MRSFINCLAIIGVIIAVALTFTLYSGALSGVPVEPKSQMGLVPQFWGFVGVILALIFGCIGRIIDYRAPKPASKLSNGSIAVGLLCGALIFAMPFVFG